MSKQYPEKTPAAGAVKISESVIRSIAASAAREVKGIADLTEVRKFPFGYDAPVTIEAVQDRVEITIRLVLESGARLPIVAKQVQQRVKESVQSMTGVIVSRVHVIAADIVFED